VQVPDDVHFVKLYEGSAATFININPTSGGSHGTGFNLFILPRDGAGDNPVMGINGNIKNQGVFTFDGVYDSVKLVSHGDGNWIEESRANNG